MILLFHFFFLSHTFGDHAGQAQDPEPHPCDSEAASGMPWPPALIGEGRQADPRRTHHPLMRAYPSLCAGPSVCIVRMSG